jgi:hypothetical protein
MKHRILKAYNDGKAISCATEEESLKFRMILHEAGVKWSNGDSVIEKSYGSIPYRYQDFKGRLTFDGDNELITFSSLLTLPADFCIQCPSDYATNKKWKVFIISMSSTNVIGDVIDCYYSPIKFSSGYYASDTHESKEIIDLDYWYEATHGEAEWQPKEGEMVEVSDDGEIWVIVKYIAILNGWYCVQGKTSTCPIGYKRIRPLSSTKYTLTEARQIIAKAEGKTVEQIEIIGA